MAAGDNPPTPSPGDCFTVGPCPHHDRIVVNHERLQNLEDRLKMLDKTINGNGRPGKLDLLSAKLERISDRVDERFDRVSEKLNRLLVVVAVIAAGGGVGANLIARLLF